MSKSTSPPMRNTITGVAVEMTPPGTTVSQTPPMSNVRVGDTQTVTMQASG